jgi:hypothetical protein
MEQYEAAVAVNTYSIIRPQFDANVGDVDSLSRALGTHSLTTSCQEESSFASTSATSRSFT